MRRPPLYLVMRLFLSLVFVFSTFVVFSQRIQNANAVYTNTAIVIRFAVAPGSVCDGFSIFHTADSTQPYVEYNVPGDCGDYAQSMNYSYAHTSFVPNVVNFYKVRLGLPSYEYSQVIRIYASKSGRGGLFLYPNPMGPGDHLLNLNAFGTDNSKMYGFLYTRFGVVKQEFDFKTTGPKAQIDVGELEQGVYVLWLTDGKTVYAGKFIVVN